MLRPISMVFFLGWLWALGPATAQAQSCENPRVAAQSLLDWLQPDQWNPTAATQCLDLAPSQQANAEQVAIQLKRVLDARGLYVPTTEISIDPNYVDEHGLHRLTPIPSFPLLLIEKKDDRWVYSRQLVEQTGFLYDATFSAISGTLQKHIPNHLQFTVFGLQTWQFIYFVMLVLLSLLASLIAQRLLADQVLRFASRFKVNLNVEVVRGTRRPLTWFVAGAVFWAGIADLQVGVRATQTLLFLANTILSLSAVVIAVRLVDVGSDFFAKRAESTESKLDDQVIPLISRAAKFTLWLLGVVFVIQNMGKDVGSLLAGLGIGGLAFALAAKDTVENFFGSITIFTDRPFQIGDWVVIGGNIEGVVEEVGFRSTRIRTFKHSLISVPNGKVANSTIDNMGQRQVRRFKTSLGLRYDTPRDRIESYVAALRVYLADNPNIWDGTCEVHFVAFRESSLEVMLYFFLDVPDWSAELVAKSECNMAFMRLAEENGVQFAFPSSSVYVEALPSDGPAQGQA